MSTALRQIQYWHACWLGELAPDEVHVYSTSLDWPDASLAWTGSWLSDTEQARARQLVDPIKRNRFSAARASLRWLLAKYLDQPPQEVVIQYEPGGKPYVPGVHFNVSHSHDRALIAITRACAVGVDVEFIDQHVPYWQVAEVAFTSQEREALSAIPVGRQRQVFYQMWTGKEALLKAYGGKLDIYLKGESSGGEVQEVPPYRILPLSLEECWAGAIALTNPPSAVNLRYGALV